MTPISPPVVLAVVPEPSRQRSVRLGVRPSQGCSEANLFLIAGGIIYAIVLALFPGLAALVLLYGLLFDASQIEKQVGALSAVLSAQTQELLKDQLHKLIEASGGALGIGAVVEIVLALCRLRGT